MSPCWKTAGDEVAHQYVLVQDVVERKLIGWIKEMISDLIELAFVLMKSKRRNKKNLGYECVVKKVQVEW